MIEVSRNLNRKRGLRRHMVQAMTAMRGQLVIRCIGRRRAIEIHGHNGRVGARHAEIGCAELARAMKQRRQQTKNQRDDKRQAALPSVVMPCTDLKTASHDLSVKSLSGLFKAGQTAVSDANAHAVTALVTIWIVVCLILYSSFR